MQFAVHFTSRASIIFWFITVAHQLLFHVVHPQLLSAFSLSPVDPCTSFLQSGFFDHESKLFICSVISPSVYVGSFGGVGSQLGKDVVQGFHCMLETWLNELRKFFVHSSNFDHELFQPHQLQPHQLQPDQFQPDQFQPDQFQLHQFQLRWPQLLQFTTVQFKASHDMSLY
jgi:hypothetical protein